MQSRKRPTHGQRSRTRTTLRATPTRRPQTAGERSKSLAGVPVLVVDDDAPSTKLLRVVLEAEGCRVSVAATAEQALEMLSSLQPRVVVVDLVLPLMSGLLFAQRLKADPTTRDIALLAVTSFNGPEAERIALEAGCSKYLRKPIDPVQFVHVLRSTLGGEP